LLGAVTDDRGFFAIEVVDCFTNEITIRFYRALQDEFGEKIHVLLDSTSYFKSQQMQEFIEDTQIEVTYYPRESPDFNPVEKCCRQLKISRQPVFSSIDELRPSISTALTPTDIPENTDYLCRIV